jgi:hypothetical protein
MGFEERSHAKMWMKKGKGKSISFLLCASAPLREVL